jgi:pimeloyl-ACP methyl ester carboxylesterase
MRAMNNGVTIHYEVHGQEHREGESHGTPVILLHGFPDSGRLWRHQVSTLAQAGFRVIVPDLRGYGGSDKPESVDQYHMLFLLSDMCCVLDAEGASRAHVIGHDWGAALAWVAAASLPQRVDHLVAMSVGHPSSFRDSLEQLEKSWYMLLFQFRGVAEQWLSGDDWANFRSWSGHPDADAVIEELENGGTLTPALNYYRANVPPESYLRTQVELPPVQAPTMGIWSTGDIALTERQMLRSETHVSGTWRYERIEGPGHWMQLEAPDAVNGLLLDFLPRL